MAVKKINENPKITDTIILEIETPDAYGCYQENPYKVDNVIIYYVERNFLGENYGEYTEEVTPYALLEKLERAKKDVCNLHLPSFSASYLPACLGTNGYVEHC